ncbi:MAG: carboxypeptidase-like regulatory domain-containing protein [Chloroflexi bacterium]|nr:MAG: carboxypeptidase-like regulatory domain-containing protein [Chloroflexota bacterium]
MNHNLVIPNDLKPIAGATVSIPALGLAATTDARGTFDIDLGEVVSDCATDVIVNAAGFGSWTYHATPIWTYEHSGGSTRLYIQLGTNEQESTYTHKLETPRPGCVRAGSTIRGN